MNNRVNPVESDDYNSPDDINLSSQHTTGNMTDDYKTDERDGLLNNALAQAPSAKSRSRNTSTESRNNSNLESLMNLVKGNIGTGILALPMAFKYGGLWVSFVGIFVLGVIAIHCIHLLVKCASILCKRTGQLSMDYGDVVEASFTTGTPRLRKLAPLSKVVINIFLCITQLGFCTVYILFVSNNFEQVIVYYFPSTNMTTKLFMLFVYLALIPYCCVRNLRTLAHFSMFANILMCIGLIITLQYFFQGLPSISDRPAFGGWSTLPMYFGIAIFAFEGIGVIMPIENKMRTPEDLLGYVGIINFGMTIVAVLYASVGFYGYLQFGDNVLGSITLNLPYYWYYNMVRIMFAVGIFISYGLQFYVPIDILWPLISSRIEARRPDLYEKWIRKYGEYILRFLLLTFTFILADSIPKLDLMISLVGALSSSAVALIFPPIIELVTLAPDHGITRWMVIKNVFIVLVGFIGFVVGTVTTLISIVKSFQADAVNLKNA